jgi:hypothetical protein
MLMASRWSHHHGKRPRSRGVTHSGGARVGCRSGLPIPPRRPANCRVSQRGVPMVCLNRGFHSYGHGFDARGWGHAAF